MSSEALHARARAFIRAPGDFDRLACDIARHQIANCPPYAQLCRSRGVDGGKLHHASDVPAVPTDAFRVARVACFPEAQATARFQTSGTTLGRRGAHELRTLDSYDAGAVAFGRRMLVPDHERIAIGVLGPAALPGSSLSHMLDLFVREMGTPASESETYFLRDDAFDLAALDERIAKLTVQSQPILLMGTTFAFVHFLDALSDAPFRLPPRSRVMHTGGVKGKSREVSASALRDELAEIFSLDPRSIVCEYGMTELSSQFYEQTIADPKAPMGVYSEPSWARVIPVHPETLEPVPEGDEGIARIVDLMNVDSAVAVLTADRVRRRDGGFELLGRVEGAIPRGCSIAIDEMLS